MISCEECRQNLYPENPTIRHPRWVGRQIIPFGSPPDCDLCSKPTYYRDLENTKQRPLGEVYKVSNVTYKVNDINTPAYKDLWEQIRLINGRLTKYFEKKKMQPAKHKPKYS